MSNFGALKSANKHILDRLFPNLWQISKHHLTYMVGIMSELNYHQNYLLSNSVLFLEIGAKSNFDWLKSANGHLLHRLFPNLWPNPNSISRIWWALFRSSITIETFCSPLQCFFCKWGQMPNFGRLKSANKHILHRLFPNLMQISQIHFAYMVASCRSSTTTKNI